MLVYTLVNVLHHRVSLLFLLSDGEPSPSLGSKDFLPVPAWQVAFLMACKKLVFNGNAIPEHEFRISRKSSRTSLLLTLDRGYERVGV